jgi:hypothetical protein
VGSLGGGDDVGRQQRVGVTACAAHLPSTRACCIPPLPSH